MKIEQRKLSDITPYHNNPRINDAAVNAVARSIQEFGFRQPLVVDEQSVIVVGHTRYKAAQALETRAGAGACSPRAVGGIDQGLPTRR